MFLFSSSSKVFDDLAECKKIKKDVQFIKKIWFREHIKVYNVCEEHKQYDKTGRLAEMIASRTTKP